MEHSLYLGDLQKDYEEIDITLKKVDIYIESMYREFIINKEESELKVLTESGTDDDLTFLYEKAEEAFSERASKTMKKITDSVTDFTNKISNTVRKKYANAKIKSAIDTLENRIKSDKRLSNVKISIIDSDGIEKTFNEAIDKCHSVASKIKDGIEDEASEVSKKINAELNTINEAYQKKKKEIESRRKEINLSSAIPYLKSKIKYTEKKEAINNVFVKISDNGSSLKKKILLKINAMIAQFQKEMISVCLSTIPDIFKKIKEIIKPQSKEVKKESTAPIYDFEDSEIEAMEECLENILEETYMGAFVHYGGNPQEASFDDFRNILEN